MQIGSTGTPHATSRLAAAANAARSTGLTRSDDTTATASPAGMSGGGNLLSYMTGQGLGTIQDGSVPLVSDQSLRAWARELGGGDRTLVESVTGASVAEDGSFVDADGKAVKLSPSETAIVAALSLMRSEQSPAEAAEPVTAEQYDALCARAQVALFQAGDLFDPAVRQTGLDHLSGVAAPEPEADLPIALRHQVQDMVDDDAYAMDRVEQYATHGLAMMVKLPVPADGREGWVDPEVVQASLDRWKAAYETVNAAHGHARTLFEEGKAAGKSGAEIYADILCDELAQPDSYWQARDPDKLSGDLKGQTQAQLRALEAAIAQRKG